MLLLSPARCTVGGIVGFALVFQVRVGGSASAVTGRGGGNLRGSCLTAVCASADRVTLTLNSALHYYFSEPLTLNPGYCWQGKHSCAASLSVHVPVDLLAPQAVCVSLTLLSPAPCRSCPALPPAGCWCCAVGDT